MKIFRVWNCIDDTGKGGSNKSSGPRHKSLNNIHQDCPDTGRSGRQFLPLRFSLQHPHLRTLHWYRHWKERPKELLRILRVAGWRGLTCTWFKPSSPALTNCERKSDGNFPGSSRNSEPKPLNKSPSSVRSLSGIYGPIYGYAWVDQTVRMTVDETRTLQIILNNSGTYRAVNIFSKTCWFL